MLGHLRHRGPDDEGLWSDEREEVILGHRRLSIIDLSSAGHQPMVTEDNAVALVFNGEIYNYQILKEELRRQGHSFRSTSDTEVILRGYEAWGSDVFNKLDGMWAIALYDARHKKLHLSRDPAGIKPLYLYRANNQYVFASEIRALAKALPPEARAINQPAIRRYLTHGYLVGEETIYQQITALPPDTTLTLSVTDGTEVREKRGVRTSPEPFTLAGAVTRFEELFEESVRATLQADVPVGLFLSGGVDSSLIGYFAKRAGADLSAFTIGFDERGFDESPVASRIARHLGFPHQTIRMRGSDVAEDVFKILDSFGEPFADMSALPTYFLSQKARAEGYKVVLGGDGADELFGGYQTHYLPQIARWYRMTPSISDTVLSAAAHLLSAKTAKLGARERVTRFLHGARMDPEVAHPAWKHLFTDEELRALLSEPIEESTYDFDSYFAQVRGSEDAASKVDFMTFLPSSCLVKSDIASMQHGLEIRVPFLNKALIEFGWNLPADLKATPFQTKKVLRASLKHFLPEEIAKLPKQGFVPPLGHWLRHELRPALLDVLSSSSVAQVSFLEYAPIKILVDEHLEGGRDHTKKLWALMSLVRFATSA